MTSNQLMRSTMTSDIDNVIRTVRKISGASIAATFVATSIDDPNSVRVHDASGGFNSVIEVAAWSCLNRFSSQVTFMPQAVELRASEFAQFKVSLGRAFDDTFLNQVNLLTVGVRSALT